MWTSPHSDQPTSTLDLIDVEQDSTLPLD